MTHSKTRKDKSTEADIAYEVLKAHGTPMHYHDLSEEVLRHLGVSQEAIQIAVVLTQINLDPRFTFLGRGKWGLKVWESTKIPKRLASISLINKPLLDDEYKSALEEIDEDCLETDRAFDELDEGRRRDKW